MNRTMELRKLIQRVTRKETGYLKRNDRIELARPLIFDFDYPIHDKTHKKELETKILKHYYFKQIGQETHMMFQFYLEEWLNLHMPYYNQLYATLELEYDPLVNTDYTLTHDKENDEKTVGKSNQVDSNTMKSDKKNSATGKTDESSFNRALKEDNPESRLSITANKGSGVIQGASEINENTGESNVNQSTSGDENVSRETSGTGKLDTDLESNKTQHYNERKVGKIGITSTTKLLQEYREAILNIDNMIVQDISVLFLGIY